jgi:hypothetical protein
MSRYEIHHVASPQRKHSEEDVRLKNTRTILLTGADPELKRREILQYFQDTYTLYERLYYDTMTNEAFYMRADPLRHFLIFYLGHTAVLYVNKLRLGKVIKDRINKHYESLFAVGVDGTGACMLACPGALTRRVQKCRGTTCCRRPTGRQWMM